MRLEVPVETALRFHNDPPGYAPPAAGLAARATTVAIKFGPRTIVWHEIPPTAASPPFPAFEYGPTVTLVSESEGPHHPATGPYLATLDYLGT